MRGGDRDMRRYDSNVELEHRHKWEIVVVMEKVYRVCPICGTKEEI